MKLISLPLLALCSLLVAQYSTTVTACDMDAKICPDGTSVGRVEPQCEFTACPAGSGSGSQPVACTAEAKVCPDGSLVGREGPNCEFTECGAGSKKSNNNEVQAPVASTATVPSAPKSAATSVTTSITTAAVAVAAFAGLAQL